MNNKENIIDVMLDLETLDNTNSPAIIQIAAVSFNLEDGECGKEFNVLINPKSCLDIGLTINGETVGWWLSQEKTVIEKVFINSITNGLNITDALDSFSSFLNSLKTNENDIIHLWGNGTLADGKWIESAYLATKKKMVWKYSSHEDVRTLVSLGKRILKRDLKEETDFVGEKHNAIDDCKHQIKYCHNIYKAIANI